MKDVIVSAAMFAEFAGVVALVAVSAFAIATGIVFPAIDYVWSYTASISVVGAVIG